jgi:hypothetical protein
MNNYPPGASSDPRAPYNQPPIEEYFPVYCQECGERAETMDEVAAHEHADDQFSQKPPDYEPPTCGVCGSYIAEAGEFCNECEPAEPIPDTDDYDLHRYE